MGCIKNTHRARGIRVFRPGLDFAKCEFGGFEIWVLQKYAQRSKNTSFLSAPRCGRRRPGGGQIFVSSGKRAALKEYARFLRIVKLRVQFGSSLGGPTFGVHQKFARRSRNTSFSQTRRFQGWHAQAMQCARARKARPAFEEN